MIDVARKKTAASYEKINTENRPKTNYLKQEPENVPEETTEHDLTRFVLQIYQLKWKICSGCYDMNISLLLLWVLLFINTLFEIGKFTWLCKKLQSNWY